MQIYVLEIIRSLFSKLAKDWRILHDYMVALLKDADQLLYPNEHEDLLFDDKAFSRFRRFFWSIAALTSFQSPLADTLEQWRFYRAAHIDPLIMNADLSSDVFMGPYRGSNPTDPNIFIRDIERPVKEMLVICERFKVMRIPTENRGTPY